VGTSLKENKTPFLKKRGFIFFKIFVLHFFRDGDAEEGEAAYESMVDGREKL